MSVGDLKDGDGHVGFRVKTKMDLGSFHQQFREQKQGQFRHLGFWRCWSPLEYSNRSVVFCNI